jgi:hypothetical protein
MAVWTAPTSTSTEVCLPAETRRLEAAEDGATWVVVGVATPGRAPSKRLNGVSVPTLVIWGEEDALITVQYAQEFGRLTPHSRVELIPDCGRGAQIEQIEAVRRWSRCSSTADHEVGGTTKRDRTKWRGMSTGRATDVRHG